MEAKIMVSINEAVIKKARRYAKANNISLSQLIESLLNEFINKSARPLEDWLLPIG